MSTRLPDPPPPGAPITHEWARAIFDQARANRPQPTRDTRLTGDPNGSGRSAIPVLFPRQVRASSSVAASFTGYCDYGISMPTQLALAGDTGWIQLDTQTGAFAWIAVPVFPSPPGKRYFRSAHIAGDLYV